MQRPDKSEFRLIHDLVWRRGKRRSSHPDATVLRLERQFEIGECNRRSRACAGQRSGSSETPLSGQCVFARAYFEPELYQRMQSGWSAT